VAVKVVEYPIHTVSTAGVIVTLTAKFGMTVITIVLDVAGIGVAQVREELRMHDTWSLFTGT